jgi:hypothetical protein
MSTTSGRSRVDVIAPRRRFKEGYERRIVAGHGPLVAAIVGGAVCFALRFGAIRHGWHLPSRRQPPSELDSETKGRPNQPTP